MVKGKTICELLKKVRRQVAEANDIDYSPVECTHKGDCAGTCPACEAERGYIESQLSRRQESGSPIKIIGLSMALFSNTLFAAEQELTKDTISISPLTFVEVMDDREPNGGKPLKDFVLVGQHAQFPGGETALHDFMKQHLRYPVIAVEAGIRGKVVVSFVINESGFAVYEKVERGVDPSLDQEILRVLRMMPKWTPAKQGNLNIREKFSLSVQFELTPELYQYRMTKMDGTVSISQPKDGRDDAPLKK